MIKSTSKCWEAGRRKGRQVVLGEVGRFSVKRQGQGRLMPLEDNLREEVKGQDKMLPRGSEVLAMGQCEQRS